MRKMAKQRCEIRECLVERGDIWIGLLREVTPNPIDYGVRGFVNDDVVRKTGINDLPGKIATGIVRTCAEVAE
jgi:hypothetical protein